MRAIAFREPGPLDRPDSLVDVELPDPVPQKRDLLVEVRAVSVNPVDVKVRAGAVPVGGDWRTVGYDAAGIVREVGSDVQLFRPGDEIFYAGSIARPGTNAELHLVNERIVGPKPKTLNWAEAAALPLTSITAWETLFDRLDVRRAVPGAAPALLIIGGTGGVGAIAVQLARQLTDLTVIATASRPETSAWARDLGAHHVIDHGKPLAEEIRALDVGAPAFVFSTTHSEQHLGQIAHLIAPQGRFALIDDPDVLDVAAFKMKSVSVHWELMFTRSLFETVDMGEQGKLLREIAGLVDAGRIRTTLTERLRPISAETLKNAHSRIEQGGGYGKLVLEGWPD